MVKKPTITETIRLYTLHWCGHTESGRQENSLKSIIYEFGNKKTERQTKKQMTR